MKFQPKQYISITRDIININYALSLTVVRCGSDGQKASSEGAIGRRELRLWNGSKILLWYRK